MVANNADSAPELDNRQSHSHRKISAPTSMSSLRATGPDRQDSTSRRERRALPSSKISGTSLVLDQQRRPSAVRAAGRLPWLDKPYSEPEHHLGARSTAAKIPGSFVNEGDPQPSSDSPTASLLNTTVAAASYVPIATASRIPNHKPSTTNSSLLSSPELSRVTTVSDHEIMPGRLETVIPPTDASPLPYSPPSGDVRRRKSMIPMPKRSTPALRRSRTVDLRLATLDRPSHPIELGAIDSISPRQVELNDSPYVPPKSSLRRLRASQSMDHAISGLENHMQEAVQVARDAAQTGHTEDVAGALDAAVDTLRKASRVSEHHAMALAQPDISSTEDELVRSMSSGYDSEGLSDIERGRALNRTVTVSAAELYGAVQPELLTKDFAFPHEDQAPQPHLPIPNNRLDRGISRRPTERVVTYTEPFRVDSWSPTSPRDERRVHYRPSLPPQPVPQRHTTALEPVQSPERRRHRRKSTPQPRGLNESYYNNVFESNDYREQETLEPTQGQIDIAPVDLGPEFRRHRFHLGHISKREPIARRWDTVRKRITAVVACINTMLVGFVAGVYAGMVPGIQYRLADLNHTIIQGNIFFFCGLALTTFFLWPLPLLYGRKPFIIAGLALAMPLHFPQATIVNAYRTPSEANYVGLMVSRWFTGMAMGCVNVNTFPVLLDLFGASLMSKRPHQEFVVKEDVRREGGGMGIWLGLWSFSFIASIAIGFLFGAGMVNNLSPQWGFYLTIILIACALVLDVIVPETRRSTYRRHIVLEREGTMEKAKRKIARGEIKLHISSRGPEYWYEEMFAGLTLSLRMLFQRGFLIMTVYLGWVYALVVLVVVLLGALLSRDYRLTPNKVGAGVAAMAVGALIAVPLSKAGIFSRSRKRGPRTDSMTFTTELHWSSHMVRRIFFTIALPLAGIGYALLSGNGRIGSYFLWAPIVFSGIIGFLANLAIAECHGLIMETYDLADLQPGVNSKHRLQSLADPVRRRRTNYTSFPRVTAGIMLSQTIGFLLAAAATGVGGIMTRDLGAQISTVVTAGILLFLSVLFILVLSRFKSVQVIPDHALGTRSGSAAWGTVRDLRGSIAEWKPVIVGNPSGKVRRMNLLELGRQSRWTEIRRLNRLLNGWREDEDKIYK